MLLYQYQSWVWEPTLNSPFESWAGGALVGVP